jgi:3-vinyl bacteriochlorophyllide hydratase
VLVLHAACLLGMATDWLDARSQMLLALAAYTVYVVNALQFLLKLRAARRAPAPPLGTGVGAAA